MKIDKIIEKIDIVEINRPLGDEIPEINDICYDSRKVTPGSLFIAIRGLVTDGHKYIGGACEKGAVCAVVEEFTDDNILQIKVKNARQAMADIAEVFFDYPSEKIDITGITATNGKTSTAFMVREIYREAGFNTGIMGTVLTEYAGVKIPSILTTPESADLQKYFMDMKAKGVDKAVMEVSSLAEEYGRVLNVDFDIVTFNNLGIEHIDEHGSFEKYLFEKSKLIKNASKESFAILNMDVPEIRELSKETEASVITYSLQEGNREYDFSISEVDLSTGFGVYEFHINRDVRGKKGVIKKGSFRVELSVAGYSSVMNSVAAIITGLVEGIDTEIIVKAMKKFKGVERRFEMIYNDRFKIIDDHFANIKNIDTSLETLSHIDRNGLRILYAVRGHRGPNLNRMSAEEMVKGFKELKPDSIYATLSRDTAKAKDRVSDEELEAFLDVMKKNEIEVEIIENLEDAVNRILSEAEKDDIVFLAGCQGMDKAAGLACKYLEKNGIIDENSELAEKVKNRIC